MAEIGRARNDGRMVLRRPAVVAAVAVVVSVALLGFAPAASGRPGAAQQSTPPRALRWGGHVRPTGSQSETGAVDALEQKLGRSLGADREFRLWDQPFPTSYDTWLHDHGSLVLLSVKPANLDGTHLLWRDIADAQPGSAIQNQIVLWANRVKTWAIPIEFTFNHEPEVVASVDYGVDADFIAAWRHVIDTFRSQGVTNARYLWITTDFGYDWPTTDRRYAPKWYPGDEWVDDMGIDAYNWYHCRAGLSTAWKSLAAIIERFRQFGSLHPAKRLWLPEWASAEDPSDPNRKAQWIADAQNLFKQAGYEQFDGISSFDHVDGNFPNCNWHVDSSTQSLTAIRAMGADAFYQAGIAAQPK